MLEGRQFSGGKKQNFHGRIGPGEPSRSEKASCWLRWGEPLEAHCVYDGDLYLVAMGLVPAKHFFILLVTFSFFPGGFLLSVYHYSLAACCTQGVFCGAALGAAIGLTLASGTCPA